MTASVVERCRSEQTILISAGTQTAAVRTTMIGDHHVSNCLVATAVGLAEGIRSGDDRRRAWKPSPAFPAGSSGSNAASRSACLSTTPTRPTPWSPCSTPCAEVTEGRLICVFGAGGDRDREKRPAMGRAVARRADLAIITSDNPRGEDPAAIARQILAGTDEAESKADVAVELDRTRAIQRALALAESGDCVLIAGKGHETFQEIWATSGCRSTIARSPALGFTTWEVRGSPEPAFPIGL